MGSWSWTNIDWFPKISRETAYLKSVLDTELDNPNYVRKTRKELLKFVIGNFIFIFLMALLSIGTMAYFLLLVWAVWAVIYSQLLRIWKRHGYSRIVLILANLAVVGLSFLITWPIRNYIQEWAIAYVRSKGY